jgi:FK506-binding protein 1
MSVEEQGWAKTLLRAGNGADYPRVGDKVSIAYTGWLRDPSNADHHKGKE